MQAISSVQLLSFGLSSVWCTEVDTILRNVDPVLVVHVHLDKDLGWVDFGRFRALACTGCVNG